MFARRLAVMAKEIVTGRDEEMLDVNRRGL
jgi:hypothetical protein